MSDVVFSHTSESFEPSSWERAIGLTGLPVLELIDRVESGLDARAFERFRELSGVPREDLARTLKVSLRTLQRRKEDGKRLDSETSERLVRLARLYARAAEVLGEDDDVKRWMRTPRPLFKNKTPFELAATELGAREVEDLLLRTEYGVFS